jgi:serine protease Do
MDDKKNKSIYDVRWREIYYSETQGKDSSGEAPLTIENLGEIKFRQNRRKSKFKGFLKGVALMLAASVSGAVAGAYVIEKKYSSLQGLQDSNKIFALLGVESTGYKMGTKNEITRVAEEVGPAVVGISNNAENFLGKTINQSTGSGIIFDSDGYIVTNYHVIEGADKVSVKLATGSVKPFNAKLIGYDKTSDLAVLKIDIEGLPVARFGDSSKVRPGEAAIAIGNPLGEEFAGSVTAGIISAVNRRIEITDPFTREKIVYKVMQTDAAINPGNSGGPLCNEYGEVIGINSLKMGVKDNAEGMGFAISINEAQEVINNILRGVVVNRPSLGISCGPFSYNGIKGVYVLDVFYGSGAAEAGVLRTDVILQIDGIKITKEEELDTAMEKYKNGDIVTIKVLREGRNIELKVPLKTK